MPMHLEYIDDLLLKLPVDTIGVVLPLLESSLVTVKLRLNRSKCKVLVPAADAGDFSAAIH